MSNYPTYAKDKGFQNKPVNYAECFGLPLNSTHLALINSCKYIHKDKKGAYTYNAVSFDEAGNVTFVREYK
jgi:hypothetical protein